MCTTLRFLHELRSYNVSKSSDVDYLILLKNVHLCLKLDIVINELQKFFVIVFLVVLGPVVHVKKDDTQLHKGALIRNMQ